MGITYPPSVPNSATANTDPAAVNFRTVSSGLGPGAGDPLGESAFQAQGVNFVVHGQPAVQIPHSLPVGLNINLISITRMLVGAKLAGSCGLVSGCS